MPQVKFVSPEKLIHIPDYLKHLKNLKSKKFILDLIKFKLGSAMFQKYQKILILAYCEKSSEFGFHLYATIQ